MYMCACLCVDMFMWILMPMDISVSGLEAGAGVTGDCELPVIVLELNSGTMQEQEAFLIAEPSLQPIVY